MTQHYAYTKNNKATRLMCEQEVAQMLSISQGTLRNQRSKKIGLPYVKIGRGVMYRMQDVLDFVEANLVAPKSDPVSTQ